MLAFSTTIFTYANAQVSSTPETPRNYKPQPKELLPMPGELTDEMTFPVLGKYEYTDSKGSISTITIYRDTTNKGIIWVNGLHQGKFKANLKASPAIYKIPVQKTLQNDVEEISDEASVTSSSTAPAKPVARLTGKSIQEGTLIFDTTTNKLYINVGAKFDEKNPTAIFPEMTATEETEVVADSDTDKKPQQKKKNTIKSVTYILSKIIDNNQETLSNTTEN